MTKSKTMCVGCRDNFYNMSGKEGCWSFANAKVVERVQVGAWEPPPYAKERAQKCLSCYQPRRLCNAENYGLQGTAPPSLVPVAKKKGGLNVLFVRHNCFVIRVFV